MARWTFVEVETGETYEMPINPDSMNSPFPERQFATSWWGLARRLRSNQTPSPAREWEFAGVIRSQAQHDALEEWASKPGLINVTDHLGRTFTTLFTAFEPTDRRPTPNTPWRLRYSMKALVLRRIA